MADETLDKKPDDLAPTDAEGSKPADEVSAALDKPAENKPADPPADPVTEAIRAEDQPLDKAVAIEAEGKPDEALGAAQEPAADATPGASTGDPEPAPEPALEPAPEVAPEALKSDEGGSTAGEAGSGGADAAPADSAPAPAGGKNDAEGGAEAGAASRPDAAAEKPLEAEPVTEAKPAEAPKPEPEAPKAPTFGDVKGEVMDLHDQLPADTLDTLRAGGCSLFLFLADMAECDTSGLSQEGRARISNVRNQAQMLLAAIESVFVRHG